ncbi:MAG: hypothetical protein O7D97_10210 [Planctomycetota bacterium]|jgi:hypothetical protein|nr:hypothetical protein [Planctomycetota bacterium]
MAKKPNEIRLPVNILLAATLCSSQDETRHYLAGVYLKARDKELRCVSTDGHRMLVISRELPKDVPQWLKDGVIVSNASLKERLALMARVGYDLNVSFEDRMVVVSETGGNLTLKDPRGDCVFRVQIVDGTFPDYEAVMASISDAIFTGGLRQNGDDTETLQMVGGAVPIGFRSQYVKSIAEVARLLGSEHVALRTSTAKNGAMITFPEADGAVLYIMPVQKVPMELAKGNSNILSLPLRRSLAALKAHATRNKGWAKDAKNPAEKAEFVQKAEDFEERIVALIEQAPGLKALPAPKAKKAANGAGKTPGKDRSKAKGQTKPKAKATAKPIPKTTPKLVVVEPAAA